MLPGHAEPSSDTVRPRGLNLGDFLGQTLAVAEAEVRKLRHDPVELLTRAIQPTLWLLVFGQVMSQLRGISSDGVSYRDFLAPGILAQSVMFIAIFYGISVIWERDSGVLYKYMVSPAPRWALVVGKALGSEVRSLTQASVIWILSALIGVHLRLELGAILGMLVLALLGSAIFVTLSLIIACLVKTRERFMGIGQLLTMPLFFASNAIYPISLMPAWLRVVAHINPLTYLVDGLRTLMLTGGSSAFGLGLDFAVLGLSTLLLVVIAARLYPTILT
ncbi:MAG: ABC transporter permease [Thermaceae bacterium]|nr:ABC transporter permease [Thermaceae bacterium]